MTKAWKFDFGIGDADVGYTKITDKTDYLPERGYGFTDISRVTARDRKQPDSLKRDMCIPADASFRVDVPNGNYMITVGMGDWILPSCTTLKANPGRLLFHNKAVTAGQYVKESVAVYVRDEALILTFSGPVPRINALEIEAAPNAINLYLAGDSTVTDQPDNGFPYAGWGQMLPRLLKHDVVVANHAESGRSSKSFINEGRLEAIVQEIKANDYLFIQFGHNDQKTDEPRYTEPHTTYKEYLRQYIDGARAVGAHPVLVTSVHRRFFEKNGQLKDTHGPYLQSVRELSGELEVPLIDLAEKSKRLFEELGEEESKSLFMWGAPGEFAFFPNGVEDNTHFQEQGAIRIAALVAEGIREASIWPLSMYLR
ncbi:rhamnogalacturonan acetylesterase [Cohnella lupini]|uniref:Lysophospholipase L1-like esterase n=1 Tax=Cohnella lupini TaxID=1294267 RepID=A0A3D9ITG9_9BACL|nr:GDSL-type esterase/lipase family protein [Cohnella lupini]RED64995.1 lysophospholipase L1-like esterase [Cohnella lupini]